MNKGKNYSEVIHMQNSGLHGPNLGNGSLNTAPSDLDGAAPGVLIRLNSSNPRGVSSRSQRRDRAVEAALPKALEGYACVDVRDWHK